MTFVSITGEGIQYHGWAANLSGEKGAMLFNDLTRANDLLRWAFKNRRCAHREARQLIRYIKVGRNYAIAGDVMNAKLTWQKCETSAERIMRLWAMPLVQEQDKVKTARDKIASAKKDKAQAFWAPFQEQYKKARDYGQNITNARIDVVSSFGFSSAWKAYRKGDLAPSHDSKVVRNWLKD